jgi:lipid II:glycine glycyltransferase (peptidoglycan interpeptide bridge formation enzyme)
MKTGLMIRECDVEAYAAVLPELSSSKNPLPLLQAPFYGLWQTRDGKTVVYFTAQKENKVVAAGLAVLFVAPGGINFFYCPYGPVAKQWSHELLDELRSFFKPIAKRHGATFVRLDSPGLTELTRVKPVANHIAVTASLQPRKEWLLDVSGDQEAIWMGLHKHARYNVRLNERANAKLQLFEPSKTPTEKFFQLMETTAGRNSFSIQSRKYYEAVLSSIPVSSGFVSLCTIDDVPAAIALFAAYDGVMHYVFAGSSNEFRKIAPPYYIMWNAILEAKKRGWHTLNFGGITDSVKSTHIAGITGFKKRFGGYEVDHTNPVDLVYKPSRYAVFSLYKRLR